MGNVFGTRQTKCAKSAAKVTVAAKAFTPEQRAALESIACWKKFPQEAGTEQENDARNAEYHDLRDRAFSFNDAKYPGVFFTPKTFDEVVNVVKGVSAIPGLGLAVCGGGHTGASMPDNSVVLDMQKLDAIVVDAANKRVIVQAGCKIGQVDKALIGTGLGFVTGTNWDTGVTGLTLGGGMGFLARKHGMACDNMLSAKVVLPTGEIVETTDESNPDLIRALRGGGGNFGVVIELTLALHDVSMKIWGGTLVHVVPTKASAHKLLQGLDKVLSDAPPHIFAATAMPCGAPVIVNVMACFGEEAETAKRFSDISLFKQIAEVPGPWLRVANTVKPRDYHVGIQQLIADTQKRGYMIASGFCLGALTPQVMEMLLHFTRVDYPNSESVVVLFAMGEKIGSGLPGRPHSVGHRFEKYWLLVEANYKEGDSQEQIDRVVSWGRRLLARALELHQATLTAHPWMEVDKREGRENLSDVYGADIKKFLAAAKLKYDPGNLLKYNVNIHPELDPEVKEAKAGEEAAAEEAKPAAEEAKAATA